VQCSRFNLLRVSCVVAVLWLAACSSPGVSTADQAPGSASTSTVSTTTTGTPTISASPTSTPTTSTPTTAPTTPTTQTPVSTTTTANRAPTISGVAITSLVAGQFYTFTPIAADADGNALSFAIANKPVWATFSLLTGALSGTPNAAQVGSYNNIVISVSDGAVSVALPAFTINVTQNATGAATLQWSAPTQNTDGSALTNLAGYRIYYGTNSSSLTQSVTINTVGTTTYVLGNLGSGTWYFGMRAFNSSGAESAMSNIASKTI
jgi:hypothetical protein